MQTQTLTSHGDGSRQTVLKLFFTVVKITVSSTYRKMRQDYTTVQPATLSEDLKQPQFTLMYSVSFFKIVLSEGK